MPPLRAGDDGLAQPAHLRLITIRETDARHGVGGDIASASRHEKLRQGRSRERLRILSNPYPRDPIRCRMRRRDGRHADREEAAFRLLQLVDFDENVGFRTVADVATETSCVQIAHTVDGVGPVRLRPATPGTMRPPLALANATAASRRLRSWALRCCPRGSHDLKSSVSDLSAPAGWGDSSRSKPCSIGGQLDSATVSETAVAPFRIQRNTCQRSPGNRHATSRAYGDREEHATLGRGKHELCVRSHKGSHGGHDSHARRGNSSRPTQREDLVDRVYRYSGAGCLPIHARLHRTGDSRALSRSSTHRDMGPPTDLRTPEESAAQRTRVAARSALPDTACHLG